MVIIEENELLHYGILRKSGRYPWGSGNNVEQRSRSFLDWITDLKRRLGWSDTQIAESQGLSSTELRQLRSIAREAQKAAQIGMAQRLKDKGYSNVAIGQRMLIPESTVRTLLAPGAADKAAVLANVSKMLKEEIAEKTYLDVGSGVENHLGISNERKHTAIAMLLDEGYTRGYVKIPQLGTRHETTALVLAAPGTKYSEIWKNRGQIRTVGKFSDDGFRTGYYGLVDPLSVSPSRVAIRYKEDGGAAEDGVIYVRPGVDDVSLGGSRYAQVRVKVGDNHYIKGMAIYKDDLPDGVDLMFNTNKSDTGNKLDALKEFDKNADGVVDPDNPFGTYIRRQITTDLPDGNKVATSAMNLVNEEGNWNSWSKTIASQVLSKQSPELAKSQLAVTFERREQELAEITALTNPTVRKKLLEEFAAGTDAAAVHLDAARLPRQQWQVILPIDTLPDTEVYAPNFRNGERVALIRYPHGGTFEIPELTVNNRHGDSKKILGTNPIDAIGINATIAERLSGADFDGDTVLVIPNNLNKIRTSPALQQLKGYDHRSLYKAYPGMPRMSERAKQKEMGDVSNLITDMTIKGASHDKISRAVRHSMVVIDAVNHNLNYKQSALDLGIRQLKEEYQGGPRKGASTLVSRAKSEDRVPERNPRRASKGGPVDPVTGRRVYEYTGNTYRNRRGEVVPSITKVERLDDTDDAHTLSSGTPMERIYAEHSNRLKAMANQARLAALNTPRAPYSPSAAKTYAREVQSLDAKLNLALRNRPLERTAQTLGNAVYRAKLEANPHMDDATKKKVKFQALEEQRRRVGAHMNRIEITPSEWDAIQAGAISDSKLGNILKKADMDKVRELATPRRKLLMTPALTRRAQALLKSGATRAEVADALGVSLTTLDNATSGKS